MRARRRWWCGGIAAAVVGFAAGPASAIYQDLTPAQVEEAVRYAEAQKAKPRSEFGKEWTVDADEWRATLRTPFSNVAYGGRLTLRFRGEMKLEEVQTLIGRSRGILDFAVLIIGPNPAYFQDLTARLEYQDRVLQPAAQEVLRNPEARKPPPPPKGEAQARARQPGQPPGPTPGGPPPAPPRAGRRGQQPQKKEGTAEAAKPTEYRGHLGWKFPLEGIDPAGKVVLVVKGPDGREARFDFDLAKMR